MPLWEDPIELLSLIKTVDIITRARVTGQKAGTHLSLFKGQGLEFSEIREYIPGDDIRAIDWKVTARYGVPHVKEYTEERDHTYYFVLDLSGSGAFGTVISKYRMMLEIFASLAFAAARYHDRAGLIIVTDRVEVFIPARGGRSHVVHLIRTVSEHIPESSKSDIRPALYDLLARLSRMTTVIILSDFYIPDFSHELTLLRHRHEVFAIQVTDHRESELPDVGLIELEDAETGEQILIDTSDPDFREEYRNTVIRADKQTLEMFRKAHVQVESVTTGGDWRIPLERMFSGIRTRGVL
ncbi:MAG TPA: DUF58 domain-containing protein [Methanospirillum sp.]|nr:DUF58 domain-containing protein [Methanospirillum sp.]